METVGKRIVKIVDHEQEDCLIILTNASQEHIAGKILMADSNIDEIKWELTHSKEFYGRALYDPYKDPSDDAAAIHADEIYNMDGDQIEESEERD